MMGAWFLGTSYSEVLAAQLGKLSVIDQLQGEQLNQLAAMGGYQQLFQLLFWIGVGIGIVLLFLSPLLNKGMHGLK
jgi:POT family proton-dependent oligopeptide transporter